MNLLPQRIILGLAVIGLAACSGVGGPSLGGLIGEGDVVSVQDRKKSGDGPLLKYAASIRINRYLDERKMGDPRKIGTGAEHVSGMSGRDIIMDQDVATMVTGSMKTSLDGAGFQVSEAEIGNAQFELGGVVRELTYNVKERDEIFIAIETTLREVDTGKTVWSAIVTEKADRFAGVAGNNAQDVASYLRKELGIVTQKTVDAISASLMVVHPELFNLTPGVKPIPGVNVLVAPTPAAPAQTPSQQGMPTQQSVASPASGYVPHASETNGLLLVNTNPPRAKVYLDGVYYGLSPLRLEMEPGIHTISVKMTGYKMVAEKVSVRKGDSTEMNLDLER